jgi:hypothetical protein
MSIDASVINDCLFELPAFEKLPVLSRGKLAVRAHSFLEEQLSAEDDNCPQAALRERRAYCT